MVQPVLLYIAVLDSPVGGSMVLAEVLCYLQRLYCLKHVQSHAAQPCLALGVALHALEMNLRSNNSRAAVQCELCIAAGCWQT